MELFTVRDAAAYLNVSERMIWYYVKEDRVKPAYRFGRSLVFTLAELNRFLTVPRRKGRRSQQEKDSAC